MGLLHQGRMQTTLRRQCFQALFDYQNYNIDTIVQNYWIFGLSQVSGKTFSSLDDYFYYILEKTPSQFGKISLRSTEVEFWVEGKIVSCAHFYWFFTFRKLLPHYRVCAHNDSLPVIVIFYDPWPPCIFNDWVFSE